MYGIVYCVHNTVNDKFYIGQTIETLEKRKKRHEAVSLNRRQYFQHALNKYGFDMFNWSVMCYADDKKSLDKAEIYWIDSLNTTNQDKGYNLKSGGSHGKHSEETKQKQSEIKKGENNPFYRKHHSAETREKQSEAKQNITTETREKQSEAKKGENNPNYGKTSSDKTRQKMSKGGKGISRGKGIPKSKEHRQKMSEAQKGNTNNLGKQPSAETRKKRSEAMKKYWKEKIRDSINFLREA